MNQQQRKELGLISDGLQELIDGPSISILSNQPEVNEDAAKAYRKVCTDLSSAIDDLRSQVEDHRDTEQEKYDNMPEAFQSGERGETMQEGVDTLEEAVDALESAGALLDDTGFAPDMVDELVEFLEGASDAIGNV